MSEILFETENKPIGSFPYIKFTNRNLSCIAHYHEELELVYAQAGNLLSFSENKKFTVNEGSFCIFMPGEIHGFVPVRESNGYVIKININSYVENINFEKIRLKDNIISPDHSIYNNLKEIIETIRNEYEEKTPGYEFAIRACKNSIISHIMRNMEFEIIDKDKNIRLLNKVNKYLEINFFKKITLEEIANECHFSKFYFSHEFKKISNTTFIQYLNDFRLEKAIILLNSSKLSMTDIALQCGFGSLRSFNRSFMKKYNISPLMYRKSFI